MLSQTFLSKNLNLFSPFKFLPSLINLNNVKTHKNNLLSRHLISTVPFQQKNLFPTPLNNVIRTSSMWKGIDEKIARNLQEDQDIKKTWEQLNRRTTTKIVKKFTDSVLDFSSYLISMGLWPIKFTAKTTYKAGKFGYNTASKIGSKLHNSELFFIRYPRNVIYTIGKPVVSNPVSHFLSNSMSEVYQTFTHSDLTKDIKKIKLGNKSVDEENKKSASFSTALALIPETRYSKLKNFWFLIEKSRNPIVSLFRYLSLIPGKVVEKIGNFGEWYLPSNNIAFCQEEIRKVDPNFRIGKFSKMLENGLIAKFMDPYLKADLEKVEKYFAERPYRELLANIAEDEKAGKVVKKKLLDVRDVEFFDGSTNQSETILTFSFTSDEAHTEIHTETGEIIAPQQIKNVSYILMMKFEPYFDKPVWEVAEIIPSKTINWI
ncbi:import inner membrane translocase subunit tim44 [Anaeramoeba flamelloides]|uniref:Import inner membrane translocase subunit tim44 n=1 Tax=Anaeramoeba flamelloides TaxID=1746091 RepID=A0ABQ8X0M2_9EUKA|nr:import inner membrane translocase subunit tim44 [Anaeramoeba flamelloides]